MSGPAHEPPAIPTPDWESVAESLWLAAVVLAPGLAEPREPAADKPPPPKQPAPDRPDRPGAPPAADAPHEEADPSVGSGGVPQPSGPAIDGADGRMPPVLAGSRSLARALRPLQRRILSTVDTEPDEEATAERAADDGLWLPMSRPAQARWLSVVLVVDGSQSMSVWRPTATALRSLLEQHGAFRSVREYVLS